VTSPSICASSRNASAGANVVRLGVTCGQKPSSRSRRSPCAPSTTIVSPRRGSRVIVIPLERARSSYADATSATVSGRRSSASSWRTRASSPASSAICSARSTFARQIATSVACSRSRSERSAIRSDGTAPRSASSCACATPRPQLPCRRSPRASSWMRFTPRWNGVTTTQRGSIERRAAPSGTPIARSAASSATIARGSTSTVRARWAFTPGTRTPAPSCEAQWTRPSSSTTWCAACGPPFARTTVTLVPARA
jgi:hypothetical protein